MEVLEFVPSHDILRVACQTKIIHWSIVLTCEHGSNELPEGWNWGMLDEQNNLSNTHWAVDLGSRLFLEDVLCELLDSDSDLQTKYKYPTDPKGVLRAIVARSSRLFIDCNRYQHQAQELIRSAYEGHIVELNRDITDEQRELRKKLVYIPYHNAIIETTCTLQPKLVLSIHSFTPVLDGKVREMEFGILMDDDNPLGFLV